MAIYLLVLNFNCLCEAKNWHLNHIYILQGVFMSSTVHCKLKFVIDRKYQDLWYVIFSISCKKLIKHLKCVNNKGQKSDSRWSRQEQWISDRDKIGVLYIIFPINASIFFTILFVNNLLTNIKKFKAFEWATVKLLCI